jgi:hypothetical protein
MLNFEVLEQIFGDLRGVAYDAKITRYDAGAIKNHTPKR